VKTPPQVTADIVRRLGRSWADDAVRLADGPVGEVLWPHDFPLGRAKSTDLAQRFSEVTKQVAGWRAWAKGHDVELLEEPRLVSGTEQRSPTHVRIPDIDTAAAIVGDAWPEKLTRARRRAIFLVTWEPALERPAKMLAATDSYSNVDFKLLLDAAGWFANSTAEQRAALTPRQVPVEGLHAKWLNTRRALVAELAGLTELGLLPPHPARIHFTYLDPDYLATGGRRHDSGSVGDTVTLPYHPRVVLISENKDTAVGFPPVPGGVAVEGAGRGGLTHAAFDWIRAAPAVVYWGDMDADGLEILNEFRAAGIKATSLLMDMATYTKWERFGTNSDPQERALGPRAPRPVDHLTEAEAELYEALIAEGWTRFRRVEQERVSLSVAHAALMAVAAGAAR
jgi:hypothetical protein